MLSQILKADFISDIQERALETIRNDRETLLTVWETIEEYCNKR